MSLRSMALRCVIACILVINLLENSLIDCQPTTGKYRMDFPEEQEPGTVVARLGQMFNVRSNDLPGRKFQILGQRMMAGSKVISSEGNWLDIEVSTGVITVKEPVDRETECGADADLECVILLQTAMMPQSHFRLQDFELVITDINDHAPKFPSVGLDRIFSLNISENSPENTKISLDQFLATDEDINENALLYYSISRNDHFGLHQYKDDTGASHLELVVLSKLDYEKIDTFDLTLTAKDRGLPVPRSSQVFLRINVIDANDNTPKFDESVYNLELRENLPAGHTITTVVARDEDTGRLGQVRYFVPRSGNSVTARRLVTVDPVTGKVRLLRPLDREIKKDLRVVIAAKDLATAAEGGSKIGKTVLLIQIMDVNDNAPQIHVNVILKGRGKAAYVHEDVELGTYIAHISASDADNGDSGRVGLSMTTYLDESKAATRTRNALLVDDYFQLKPDNLIATNAILDREEQDRYIIKITACDFGNPKRCSHKNLSVIVLDANDHWPKFKTKQHVLTLPESTRVGSYVTSMKAYDEDDRNTPALTKAKDGKIINSKNGEVRYSLIGGGAVFAIESKTGKITLVGKLDYEKQRTWKLTVVAQDLGEPQRRTNFSLSVKVTDVNDHKPEFKNPGVSNMTVYATILEDRTILRIKTIDRDAGDNAEVWYSISSEDGARKSQKFLIDPVTGSLRLNASNKLTALLGEHTLTILAKDKGTPPQESETRLIVKVTDLPLSSIIPNYQEPEDSESSRITVIVLSSLASATVILLLLLACIVIKCRRENKEIRTYNCRAAETKSGRSLAFGSKNSMSHIGSVDEVVIVSTPGVTTTKDVNFGKAMKLSRTRSMTLRNSKTDGSNLYKYATIDKGPSFTTFTLPETFAANSATSNQVAYSHTDGDSGKGESDKDTDSVGVEKDQQEYQTALEGQAQRCKGYMNDLGPRCTISCRQYGHCDECWMPVVAHCDIHGEHESFEYCDDDFEMSESASRHRPEHLLQFAGGYGNYDNCGLETISETQPLRIILDTAEQSSMFSSESYDQQDYPSYPTYHHHDVDGAGLYSPNGYFTHSNNQRLLPEHTHWRDACRPPQTNEYNTSPQYNTGPPNLALSKESVLNNSRPNTPSVPVPSSPHIHGGMTEEYGRVLSRPQSLCDPNSSNPVLSTGSVMDKVKRFSQAPVRRGSLRDQVLQTRHLNVSLQEDSTSFKKKDHSAKHSREETDFSLEKTRKILSDIDDIMSSC